MPCDLACVQWAINQPYSDELLARIQHDAGAHRVRTLRPGDMATMEYNESRLNIDLDENDRVIRLRCG